MLREKQTASGELWVHVVISDDTKRGMLRMWVEHSCVRQTLSLLEQLLFHQ